MLHQLLKDLQITREELAEYSNSPSWNRPAFYIDDDEEYSIQFKKYLENLSKLTPDLPTEEPEYSLSMGDEHLSTILETESDKVIKSSVENLVPIPRESEGVSDDTCDVPFCVNSPLLDASPLEDFLIMENEELSTIPEKELNEFIKSSVKDLIPIPRESEDSSEGDSESVLPSSDDFSPILRKNP
ncbi:hypothetical protein Tco_0206902 [Tanacetum coccineum]